MRIRQGNDFIFLWAIERNGEPENFSNAVNIRLHFKNFDCIGEVKSFQIVDGNIVRVEVSPEWASNLGAYRLILSYEFENQSYSDGDQKCVVDILAFNIVPKTSEADDITEMAKTTDIMIGLQGLSAYEVWLKDNPDKTKDDYYNWLQKPATDAAASIGELEQTIEGNEALRVTAEQGRSDAELLRVGAEGIRDSNETDRINAEGIRDANETDRINAESDRADAEDLRNQAEVAREEAEELRQTNTNTAIQNAGLATTAANTAAGLANNAATAANTAAGDANNAAEAANTAAGLANNAATTANTAAQNADNARLAIQSDLGAKAFHGYASIEVAKTLKQVEDDTINTTEKPTAQSLSELNARITALEAILTNKIKDRIDVTKEFNVWGKTNLILTGSGAATFAPDFVGQKYIDTTGGNVYVAVGVSNAGNWKLV
jgi:hypothetical protein